MIVLLILLIVITAASYAYEIKKKIKDDSSLRFPILPLVIFTVLLPLWLIR